MAKPDDLSKPLVALDHDSTLVCVIEMSGTSWLVAATVPGVDRRPLQKLPVNPARLLEQVERWRKEAARAGRTITRTVVVNRRQDRAPWRHEERVPGSVQRHCCLQSMVEHFFCWVSPVKPEAAVGGGP